VFRGSLDHNDVHWRTAIGYEAAVAASNTMSLGNNDVVNTILHGRQSVRGVAPGVSGTGCTLAFGNDAIGAITATDAAACALTVATAYVAPVCVLTASTATALPYVSALATTGFTATTAAAGTVYYRCVDFIAIPPA
jgi:hypothetical protein